MVKTNDMRPVTRQEIEQKMDELAREYQETHDPEIPENLDRLTHQFRELDHQIERVEFYRCSHAVVMADFIPSARTMNWEVPNLRS